MLQVKEAVKVSLSTFADLFPSEAYQDLRLEEVLLSDDEESWKVTVSYRNPDFEEERQLKREENTPLAALTGGIRPIVHTRHYKSIRLKVEDGSLIGISNAN